MLIPNAHKPIHTTTLRTRQLVPKQNTVNRKSETLYKFVVQSNARKTSFSRVVLVPHPCDAKSHRQIHMNTNPTHTQNICPAQQQTKIVTK